jgi:hypothetical protein
MKHDRHTNCHTISITLDPNLFSSLSLFLFSLRCLSLLLPFLGDTLTDPSLSSLTPAFITHSLLSLSPSLRSLRHYGAALSLLFVLASFHSVLFALPTLICFLSLRRGAYCNPWLLPPWPLARVCWLSRQPQGLTSLLTLDLCMRLSPRPPSIKVWQRPPSLSLWLSCVEIWPVKLIRTKTTVSAFKQLQREGGGWWSCPSVVGCALTVPSLLADLIFSGSGKP